MSTMEPLILVLDADLSMIERRRYELRGAKFDSSESIRKLDDIPATIERIWMWEGLPDPTQARIIQLAAAKKLPAVSSSIGLVSLRELLDKLPKPASHNGRPNSEGKERRDREKKQSLPPQQTPEERIIYLQGQLSNALERVQELEDAFSRLSRQNAWRENRWLRVEVLKLRQALAEAAEKNRSVSTENRQLGLEIRALRQESAKSPASESATEFLFELFREAERILYIHRIRMEYVHRKEQRLIEEYEKEWREIIDRFR
ncbi:MAG: hypothetical protein HY545_02325 [Candidatus Doudnabacteria bacterium]|nr:hypothetical protein [Candidatus Doudnabacteria bacterium]